MKLRTRYGFTLIELVIYVGIFAIIISFVIGIVGGLGGSANANRGRVTVNTESDLVMGKIKWAMAGARAITSPAASSTSGTLSVLKYDPADNPIVIQIASGTITLSRAGGPAVPLTSGNARADDLRFTHNPETSNAPESVSVALAISASSSDPAVRASTMLQTTLYLR